MTNKVPDSATISKPSRAGIASASWVNGANRIQSHDCLRDKDGVWRILSRCYYARIRSEDGGYTLLATGLDDEEAATRWAVDRQGEHDRIRKGLQTRREVTSERHSRSVLADHIGAYVTELGPRTSTDYSKAVTYRLNRLVKELDLKRFVDIDPSRLNAWAMRTAAAGESHRSVNTYLNAVKSFVNWAIEEGRTDQPVKGIRMLPSKPVRPRRALSVEEFDRLVEAALARGAPARVMVYRVAVGTGLRKDEIATLTIDQIDTGPEPLIRLRGEDTKNGKADVLPISRQLADQLTGFVQGRTSGPVFKSVPRPKTFKADLKEAGIEARRADGMTVDFHSLRTTYITWLMMSGVSPRTAQALARHSDIKLTMQTYTDESLLPKRESLDMMTTRVATISSGSTKHTSGRSAAWLARLHGVYDPLSNSEPDNLTQLNADEAVAATEEVAEIVQQPPEIITESLSSLTTRVTTISTMNRADLLKLMAEIVQALDD